MDNVTVFILANLLISVVAILTNDAIHRRALQVQRRDGAVLVKQLSTYLAALESSNNVLLARQEQIISENNGLRESNYELQQDNQSLYRELNSDAELKQMFGDYS